MKKTFIIIVIFFLSRHHTYASDTPKAIITIQKGELTNMVPFSLNLDGSSSTSSNKEKLEFEWIYPDNKIITSKNPRSYRFEKAGTYEISLKITTASGLSDTTSIKITALPKAGKINKETQTQNGNLSTKIEFSEIMANPKGTDSGNEWLELFNADSHDVNLGNWQISNSSKSFKLNSSTIIKAGKHFIIDGKNLKISLKNSNEKLTLRDFNNKIIDSVEYKKSTEGKSYSKISQTKWIWTEPSKNGTNAEYKIVEGKIINELIDQKFTIITDSQKIIDIFLSKEINENLFKTILKAGKKGKFSIEQKTKTLESMELENFTQKNKVKEKTWIKSLIISLIILLTSSLWLSWRCKSFQQHHLWSIPKKH